MGGKWWLVVVNDPLSRSFRLKMVWSSRTPTHRAMALQFLTWILESQVVIVKDHSDGLKKCMTVGSVTARLVMIWAPIMCFPQWIGGFIFAVLGCKPAAAIFSARMAAMCVVRKLDEHIPYTRALGLCHLVTFGPVLFWLLTRSPKATDGLDGLAEIFVTFEKYVISLCLFLDARDLILYCLGYPFPCYIRHGVRAGVIPVKDARAKSPVTLWSCLIGPWTHLRFKSFQPDAKEQNLLSIFTQISKNPQVIQKWRFKWGIPKSWDGWEWNIRK